VEFIQTSLLRAGLRREEEDLARLLPWLRVHRESEARLRALPLLETEPQTTFRARWGP
jgi:hypothetical protein